MEILAGATLLASTHDAKARQVQKLMTPLLEHLSKHHAQVAQNLAHLDQSRNWTQFVELQVANFRGWLLLDAFETTDPVFLEQREFARAAIHRKTLRAPISDDRLIQRLDAIWADVDGVSFDRTLYPEILNLLRTLRDYLEDRSPHVVDSVPTSDTSNGAS